MARILDRLRILEVCRDRWLTAAEVSQAIGVRYPHQTLQALNQLQDRGFMRARHRPKSVNEDGRKPGGYCPREFRVTTRWGGLA